MPDGWKTWLPLYLLLTLASGFVDLRVRAYPDLVVKEKIPEVIAGTADAPGLYRVLAPFAYEGLARASGWDRMTVWHVTRLGWFLASWFALHAYLRTWFPVSQAIAGTFIVAALLPLTYTNSWAHPDHIPELALFTLGCLAVARGREGWFLGALVLATLNRETALYLVILYLVAGELTSERVTRAGLYFATWFGIYAGLRGLRGFKTYEYWQLSRNYEFLKLLPANYDPYYRAYAWFGIALAVVLTGVAWRTRKEQPRFVRGAVQILPIIFLVSVTLSSIIETRILTPMLPLVLPALMFTVRMPKDRQDGSLS
jgi:hypothetical protein